MKLLTLLIVAISLSQFSSKIHRRIIKRVSNSKRKLGDFFITTTFDADEKKQEQDLRFRELLRTAVSNRQNDYLIEKNMYNEEQGTMQEMGTIYENTKGDIIKAKETLLGQIDQIFNNEIYQNKWFY